jgi:glycosyltransferase involved in cell wall biosynthesis
VTASPHEFGPTQRATTALRYALVTPARNEAAYIESTIRSVIAQRVRPVRWIIVSDGSTDETDAIVQRHAEVHPWIECVRMPPRAERHFAGKVHAFNAGYARLGGLDYELIGSLDADISFGEGYFELLLSKFAEDELLGVAGTPFQEDGRQYDYRYTNIEHVSGACQMFRRQCFESIGGYRAVAGGGIDWIAVTMARMNGWKTRTFVDTYCTHLRPMGTAENAALSARFRLGRKDYRLGGHPLWEILRGIHQMRARPYGIGGLMLLAGFFWDFVRRSPKSVQADLQRFHRGEQMRRLQSHLLRRRGTAAATVSLAPRGQR